MSFFRPCWAEIHLNAFRNNLHVFKSLGSPSTHLLAVLKANAYGHGVLPLAQVCESESVDWMGVASLDEGIELRKAGIQKPILILGSLYPFDGFSEMLAHHLTPTIASFQAAESLSYLARTRSNPVSIHLKIDSGFGRIGVSVSNATEWIQRVQSLPGIVIEGLYTQLATADEPDTRYAMEQFSAFEKVIQSFKDQAKSPAIMHVCNSAAALRFPQMHLNLIRPGLGLYGIMADAEYVRSYPLQPVMSWKTRIVYLKKVPSGTPISYGRTWKSQTPSTIATLAVGYGDGYRRNLSNVSSVLVRGKRAPVVGRVTMDMTMVDVTAIADCQVGDEVVLLGSQGTDHISMQELAGWAQTSVYEIPCGITARVPRIVHD